MSRGELSRALKISSAQLSRLLHGLRGPSLNTALEIGKIFPRVRPVLWTKPCPPNWRPHSYPDLRRRARTRAASAASAE